MALELTFELHKNERLGQFWFVIKAANGQTIVTSEMYTSKQSAVEAITLLKMGVRPHTELVDKTK